MPTVLLLIGIDLPMNAGEVYSVPCTPVKITAGAGIEYGSAFGGPFAGYVANTPIKCGFVRAAGATTIRLARIRPKAPGWDL